MRVRLTGYCELLEPASARVSKELERTGHDGSNDG